MATGCEASRPHIRQHLGSTDRDDSSSNSNNKGLSALLLEKQTQSCQSRNTLIVLDGSEETGDELALPIWMLSYALRPDTSSLIICFSVSDSNHREDQ